MGIPNVPTDKITAPGGTGYVAKCKQRFNAERNGWKFSLLCELPTGHQGPHIDDCLNVLEYVIPEIVKRYEPPLIG